MTKSLYPEPGRSKFIESCQAEGISDFQCNFNAGILDVFYFSFISLIIPFASVVLLCLFVDAFVAFQQAFVLNLVEDFDRVLPRLPKYNFWRSRDYRVENAIVFILTKFSVTSEIYASLRNYEIDCSLVMFSLSLERLKKEDLIDYRWIYLDSGLKAREWCLTYAGIIYLESISSELSKLRGA
jgi:hypothetical protein